MKLDETECRIIVAALGEYRQILALTEDPDRPVTDLHLRHVDDVEHLYDRFIGSLPENQNEGRVVKIARAASDVAQRSLALARLTRVANPQQSSGKQLFLACLLTVVLLFLLVPTDPMPKYPAALADLDVKALLDQLIGFLARNYLLAGGSAAYYLGRWRSAVASRPQRLVSSATLYSRPPQPSPRRGANQA